LLKIIDKLAESIPCIEFIDLQHGSAISICDEEISLRDLKILTKGESWYNSLGYKSPIYEDEKNTMNELEIQQWMNYLP
jgi:hypothetical protein